MAELVTVLKALAAEPRLKIVELLKQRPLCVNAITARLGMTQSAVSQHLRVLRNAGLVKAEKRGYWMHYSLEPKALERSRVRLGEFLAVGGHPSAGSRRKGGVGPCVTRKRRSGKAVRSPRSARGTRRSAARTRSRSATVTSKSIRA